MTDFIPPFPARHKKSLGPLDMIKHARRDLLSIWPEKAFDRQFMALKVLNRPIFIANHPDVVRHVLIDNHANYESKIPLMRKALEPLLGDGLLVSDGSIWHQRRELQEPFMAAEQVGRFNAIIQTAIKTRLDYWATLKSGNQIPVLNEMRQFSAEVICKSLFGSQISQQDINSLMAGFSECQQLLEDIDLNTFFGLPDWLSGNKAGKTAKAAKDVHDLIDKLMGESPGDSLAAQLLAKQSTNLSRVQIRNEVTTLFMGGFETIANTLAWAWYLVSQSPEVEARLQQEADTVKAEQVDTLASATELPFTNAIIAETLRLYPPLPILARLAKAEDTLRERHIPPGSILIIAPWLLHRHQQYWDKPDHFRPERFLPEAPVKPDPFAYIPFSVGPRSCLGKHLASATMTLCLAKLARQFRLAMPEGQQLSHECRLTLRPKGELPMHLFMR
jgi:cytochrome P450